LKKNNDWTYLSISQWGPATLIRKTQSKAPLQVFSEKSFNFQYNVPLEFKWVISENGKQSLYLDGNLLNEWAGIPNDSYSPDNLSGVRAAFNMSLEFDKGFIGIGDLNIQLNDVK